MLKLIKKHTKIKIVSVVLFGILATVLFAKGFDLVTTKYLEVNRQLSFSSTAKVKGDIIPLADDTYDLGSASLEFTDLHVDGTANLDVVDIDGAVDIDNVLTVDGINASDVVVTDASTYTLLLANTGMVHTIADLSQDSDIDFPVEAAGLVYIFQYNGGAADAHDHTFDTGSDTNFFVGGFAFLDTDAGSGADEVHIGVYSDGNSNSKFTVNNMAAGTRLRFSTNGTVWNVTGTIMSDTVPVFADQ